MHGRWRKALSAFIPIGDPYAGIRRQQAAIVKRYLDKSPSEREAARQKVRSRLALLKWILPNVKDHDDKDPHG